MIRTILFGILLAAMCASPGFRLISSNALRRAAIFIEPKQEFEQPPKYFKIPNPFYKDKSKSN